VYGPLYIELPELEDMFLSRLLAIIHSTANTTANIRHRPVMDTAIAKLRCDTQMASSGVYKKIKKKEM
jgi:hypothetical protein